MKQNKNYFYFDNKKIGYISSNELKEKHPEGNYSVGGEICVKKQRAEFYSELRIVNGFALPVHPFGTYSEKKYKTAGYVPSEDNEYIAVKKKKISLMLILAPLFLALLLLLGGLFILNNRDRPDIDPNAGDYDSALKRPDNIDSSQIMIPGYGKFTVQKNSDTIDTAFFNPEGNPCYFQITLMEKDTGDILYESKLIPPGKGITPVKMTKSFSKTGSYNAVLKFRSYDFEDTSIEYNGSEIDVTLNVVE